MGIVVGLLGHLVLGLVHFAVIATDVVFFFLLVRLLAMRWPNRIVVGLDGIGSPLVETLTSAVGSRLPGASMKGRLLLVAALLTVFRLGLLLVIQPWT